MDLAEWTERDVWRFIDEHKVQVSALHDEGYPSIGCAPCTSKVKPGEDPRAGRWRDEGKEECGIHFINGRIVRGPIETGDAA